MADKDPPRPRWDDPEGDVVTKPERKTKTPERYKVLLHNDDYTTQEFVIHILMKFFKKSNAAATYVMLMVHTKGIGLAGVYTRDVAETKVQGVVKYAREAGHPLMVTAEKE